MDFEQVLKALLAEFDRLRIRYAAIGGFALGVLGVPRATVDLDFLVHRDDLDTLHEILERLGYLRRVRTENVSHYDHRDAAWGALDFVHAFRRASLEMLGRAKEVPIFDGTATVRVAQAEDVIGLKVQAMVNDPGRRSGELHDIERLMRLHGGRLDWARIQAFYELFDLREEGQQMQRRFGHAE